MDRLFVGDSTFSTEDLTKLRITKIINVGGVQLLFDELFFALRLTDDGKNEAWKFTTILDRMHAGIRSENVLVCCRAGISRSPYMILLWLRKMGMSKDEAYNFLKEKHPITQINVDLLGRY